MKMRSATVPIQFPRESFFATPVLSMTGRIRADLCRLPVVIRI
jgi:hypothetical protein